MNDFLAQDDDYRGQLDLALWKRIVGHARPYRRQLIGLGLSGLVIAVIDALFPLVTGLLIDEAIADGLTSALLVYGGGYFALLVGFAVCVWVFIVLAGQTATGVACDLRRAGFSRLHHLTYFRDLPQERFTEDTLMAVADKAEEIVLYCDDSSCPNGPTWEAAKAANWGYQKVYFFAGDAQAWKEAGYPVETGQ